MKKPGHFLYLLLISLFCITTSLHADRKWPREIQRPEGLLEIHQPQPESLIQNTLSARAAVSFTDKDIGEQLFGAVWFKTSLVVDKDNRQVILMDFEITNIRAPHATKGQQKELREILKSNFPKKGITVDLDRFISVLSVLKPAEARMSKELNTISPRIHFLTKPATLIQIDGTPKLDKLKQTSFKYIVNTGHHIVYDPRTSVYYTPYGDDWFSSKKILSGWKKNSNVPTEIKTTKSHTTAPTFSASQIIVATKPTELLITEGKPIFVPISGTNLIYVKNSDASIFLDMTSSHYFTIIGGRWFKAPKLTTKYWQFAQADSLPSDFHKIPKGHPKGSIRVFLKGTPEAAEAVAAAMLPQSVQTKRHRVSLNVEYDGQPSFKKIKSTSMHYAENTKTPVIKINSSYYACEKAVWFKSFSPFGPWQLTTSVPTEIYSIPPESHLYYITFVHIYGYDTDYIYSGYTPGYTGTYIYEETIVYGTGYIHPGWYHHYYYGHPHTYGATVYYNSETGNWIAHKHTPHHHHTHIHIDEGWAKERRKALNDWYDDNKGKFVTTPEFGDRYKERKKDKLKKRGELIANKEGHLFKNEEGTWKKRDGEKWNAERTPPKNVINTLKSRQRGAKRMQRRGGRIRRR